MHHPAKCSIFFLTLFSLLLISTLASAGEFNAFGPISYQRGTGTPVTETTTFTVKDPTAPYVIRINNGGLLDGEFEKVSSSVFILNGVQIAGPNEFNQNVSIIKASNPLLQQYALCRGSWKTGRRSYSPDNRR